MTSSTNDQGTLQDPEEASPRIQPSKLQRFASWAEKIVDKANPILVKETRQALKSRQFVITFLIVLIACWIASFAVVAIIGPSVFYAAEGSRMLLVYCIILAFPLILIVPYSAFRSLAVEQEDNTYDLLSITTLTSGQIVSGKLGSAIVQMLVYLSAVSPCIAFTFLLRGVDGMSVIVLLIYFVLFSAGLSMIALLAGTMSRIRYMQALLSVLLVLCLGFIFFNIFELIEDFIRDSDLLLQEKQFWVGNLFFLIFYLTTFALLHASASAQIAFNSENRSSRIRYLLIIQHACILGWAFSIMLAEAPGVVDEWVFIVTTISAFYWYGAGIFMTSEWPHLSRRVQRDLPKSSTERTLFTWFNPGPGTGYMFCIANLSMVVLISFTTIMLLSSRLPGSWSMYACYLALAWSYVVLFLGLGRLLIVIARRFTFVSMTAGVLLQFILLLAGCGAPQVFEYISSSTRFGQDYSLLHLSNPFWTMMEITDQGLSQSQVIVAMTIICSSAVITYLINVRLLGTELHYQRAIMPTRIVEDEAELRPAIVPKPANPWE